MYDFLRVAAATPKTEVANIKQNTENIIKILSLVENDNVDIVVFPELCVSGYTCQDLFFQQSLLKESLNAVVKIADASKKSVCAVGFPIVINSKLYNAAAICYNKKILGIAIKTYMANYNEYYEKRWFSSANELDACFINSSVFGIKEKYDIPVGNNLVFNIEGIKFGAELCEDLWSPVSPGAFLALGGADVILNLSASNETVSKGDYRKKLVEMASSSLISGYVYSSAGSGESTTDLVFSGHSIIAENGKIVAQSSKYIQNEGIIIADIDCGKIKADRIIKRTFGDCRNYFGNSTVEIEVQDFEIKGDGKYANISKTPFISDEKNNFKEIFEMQVQALRKRIEVTGLKPIVGVSGGLDSTLALLISVATIKSLEMPASAVTGITMPCFGTTDRTYTNAVNLIKALGADFKEINIENACKTHFKDLEHDISKRDLTYENTQARERTQILMDYAGKVNGFVVGTGDLSELALGWCTYNGDHMSMYGVNSGVPKTLIKDIILNVTDYEIFKNASDILLDITDTPISPELLPPDIKGEIAQKTEDLVGPYILHDFFIYYVLRYGFSPKKIYFLAKKAFNEEYADEIILKWLKYFYKRFFTQQFKRSAMPDGVKVVDISVSPRGDLKMPSDASFALWQNELEEL